MSHPLLDFSARQLRDVDGRPVAEVASPLYDPDQTELVACPYRDRRHGEPMNQSALRQLEPATWRQILATVRSLVGSEPVAHDALRAVVAGLMAPSLLPAPTPRAHSLWFKTSLGYSQILVSLLLASDEVAGRPLAALGDRETFCQVLDQQGWLLGQSQVCAGPMGHIGELFAALCGTPGQADPTLLSAVRAPSGWLDEALVALGLAVAHTASLGAAVRAGALPGEDPCAEWLQGAPPPWLAGVFHVPARPPEHARRLFPDGKTPEAVERYLAAGPAAPDALRERLAACLAGAHRDWSGAHRT